ncbi:S-adenosylmethionine sensor upstream of mTORC1, partial [Pseudolycoriella hygida]
HLILSTQIKKVHRNLRKKTKKFGSTNAWNEHLNNKDQLEERERRIYELISGSGTVELTPLTDADRKLKIRLMDVGSCYNPFKQYDQLDVTAIDISPACPDVHWCDFLNAPVLSQEGVANSEKVFNIISSSQDVVVFSLLLEYLPTSEQRLTCCEKAYEILDTEGILIIIVPDSKHVGANAKLLKNWRYTLAMMGFSRIKFEKFVHITCMVFRKALFKEVTFRWANIHKEEYMTNDLFIPQDSNDFEHVSSDSDC